MIRRFEASTILKFSKGVPEAKPYYQRKLIEKYYLVKVIDIHD